MKKLTYALVIAVIITILAASTVLADSHLHKISPAIMAGKNTHVGVAKIWNDSENLNVEFMLKAGEGWCITEFHVHVGSTLDDFPKNGGGNVIPGQFDYKAEFGDCLSSYIVVIPLSDLADKGIAVGDEFFLAVHSVAFNQFTGQEETGWAVRCTDLDGAQFSNKSGWTAYITFQATDWNLPN